MIKQVARGGQMLRKLAILGAAALCAGVLLVPAAWGSVPKVIVIEEYGATW
jgi:hypothetical protein